MVECFTKNKSNSHNKIINYVPLLQRISYFLAFLLVKLHINYLALLCYSLPSGG